MSLLLIPWQWLAAWIIAVTVHELFHYMALRRSAQVIASIELGIGGVVMETDGLPHATEVFCAIAGPIGSLLLTFLSPIVPRVAICSFFHLVYNLLPLYPLDGGRVLRSVVACFLPQDKAVRLGLVIEYVTIGFLIFGVGFTSIRFSLGVLPIFLVTILLMKIKIPCKRKHLRVQ